MIKIQKPCIRKKGTPPSWWTLLNETAAFLFHELPFLVARETPAPSLERPEDYRQNHFNHQLYNIVLLASTIQGHLKTYSIFLDNKTVRYLVCLWTEKDHTLLLLRHLGIWFNVLKKRKCYFRIPIVNQSIISFPCALNILLYGVSDFHYDEEDAFQSSNCWINLDDSTLLSQTQVNSVYWLHMHDHIRLGYFVIPRHGINQLHR